MRCLLALGLLLRGAHGATPACSERKDCGSCGTARDSGEAPCFWCYDGGGTCKDMQNPVTHGGKVLQGCKRFSFTSDACGCFQYQTCGECATPQHAFGSLAGGPMCEWTSTTANLSVTAPVIGTASHSLGSATGCRVAARGVNLWNAATGPGTQTQKVSWTMLGADFEVALIETPTSWYWAQCGLSGPAPFAIVSLSTALLLLCCVCLCCRCCGRKKRERAMRQRLLQEPVVMPIPRPLYIQYGEALNRG